ncbi:uncharacterized protein [Atheta coriaria]|uniref:uncharacterized protein isoform X2 n=1 Tax=Dalotia coriaria TaxID=877792 RepID=UPI0031F46853
MFNTTKTLDSSDVDTSSLSSRFFCFCCVPMKYLQDCKTKLRVSKHGACTAGGMRGTRGTSRGEDAPGHTRTTSPFVNSYNVLPRAENNASNSSPCNHALTKVFRIHCTSLNSVTRDFRSTARLAPQFHQFKTIYDHLNNIERVQTLEEYPFHRFAAKYHLRFGDKLGNPVTNNFTYFAFMICEKTVRFVRPGRNFAI